MQAADSVTQFKTYLLNVHCVQGAMLSVQNMMVAERLLWSRTACKRVNHRSQCSVVHGGKMLRAHAGVARSPVFKTQIQVRPK